jgi:predicted component of type VI protein secretion system
MEERVESRIEERTMAKLIGMSGEFKDREFTLAEGVFSVGRKSDNVILLDHPTISSHHCEFVTENGACVLRDLGSTNGTRVNGRDVTEQRLANKDLIQLGSIEFLLEAPEYAGEASRYAEGDAETVSSGEIAAPQDFTTISPFGAPPVSKPGMLYFLLILVGLAALATLGWFFAVWAK